MVQACRLQLGTSLDLDGSVLLLAVVSPAKFSLVQSFRTTFLVCTRVLLFFVCKDHFVDESRRCLKNCALGLSKRLQVLFLYPVNIFGNAPNSPYTLL